MSDQQTPLTGRLMSARTFLGHDPDFMPDGCDVLLRLWDNGLVEVALRPGHLRRGTSWGPPVWPVELQEDE